MSLYIFKEVKIAIIGLILFFVSVYLIGNKLMKLIVTGLKNDRNFLIIVIDKVLFGSSFFILVLSLLSISLIFYSN